MPSYWRVAPRFWTDPAMRRAGDDARLLALYLLTCPHRNVIGLFWLPKAYMCADLSWGIERLGQPFGKLLAAGFLAYDDDAEVVLIRNALKYQSPENDNQVVAALRHIDDLPATFLASEFRGLAERFCERLAKALPDGFGQPLPDPTTPTTATTPATTPATDNTVVDPATPDRPGIDNLVTYPQVSQVWQAWIESLGENRGKLRLTPKRKTVIRARLREYPLEDVLDAARGWPFDPWPERVNHNDLTVLLRNGEQVEKFRDLYRHGPPHQVSKPAAQAMRTSVAMRARAQARAQAEEVNDDRGRVGRSGGPAQHGLPAPAD